MLDGANQPIMLRGVNRSGSEYACIQGWGFFDGPSDPPSIQAIMAWGANTVRIPLNEGCWLSINDAPPPYSGEAYRNAISSFVATAQAGGLVPILELHWSGAGSSMATGMQPMPNRDHSLLFWQQVATAYRGNRGIIFDLHNEPYPDGNRDTAAAWECWKHGTTTSNASVCPGSGLSYQAAGIQELVDVVRGTSAENVIMLGGVQYSNALSGWLSNKPTDPSGNLVAAWHVYNFNICNNVACYNATAGPVAAQVPLVASEIGQNDCGSAMLTTLMSWLDAHNSGYLAWTWNTWGTACGNLSLIVNFSGAPTPYGQLYRSHLASVVNVVLVGHVNWEGRPGQPHARQQAPITLTLRLGSTEVTFPTQTTTASGYFTVSVASLAQGTYSWRVKGPTYLANSGSVALTGALTTSVEMGLMRAGDANNDNAVNTLDFMILRSTYSLSSGDPGYNARADFSGDGVVNCVDFSLLRGNFGQSGAPPVRPTAPK